MMADIWKQQERHILMRTPTANREKQSTIHTEQCGKINITTIDKIKQI